MRAPPPPFNHWCPLDCDSQGSYNSYNVRVRPQIIANSSQIQRGQKEVHCHKAMYWVLH